jgi:hypothetical protein
VKLGPAGIPTPVTKKFPKLLDTVAERVPSPEGLKVMGSTQFQPSATKQEEFAVWPKSDALGPVIEPILKMLLTRELRLPMMDWDVVVPRAHSPYEKEL